MNKNTEQTEMSTGLVFSGTHYGRNGDHEFVEVLGGPVPVEAVAAAIEGRLHRLPSRGFSVDANGEFVGLSCGSSECVARLVDLNWCGFVPDDTDLALQAWPCPGDECACRVDELQAVTA